MKYFLLLTLFILSGCGALVPTTSKKTSSTTEAATASVKNSEQFSKIVNGYKPQPAQPVADFKIGGLGNKVEVTIPKAPEPAPPVATVAPVVVPQVVAVAPHQPAKPAQQEPQYHEEITYSSNVDAAEKESTKSASTKDVTIPLGVNLALLGIGILILIFAIRKARQSSLAVDAAYQTFDTVLATQIRSVRDKAILATDNTTISALQAQIAELEAQRGRLAR